MKRMAWAALLAGMCIAVSAFAAMIGGAPPPPGAVSPGGPTSPGFTAPE
jgi:uncharacterized RDD family membrane protein YckC